MLNGLATVSDQIITYDAVNVSLTHRSNRHVDIQFGGGDLAIRVARHRNLRPASLGQYPIHSGPQTFIRRAMNRD
ncbi:hypothetical protein RBB50_001778 [Rhinocladiella similis]